MPSVPRLPATYADCPAKFCIAHSVLTATTRPHPRSIIEGTNAWHISTLWMTVLRNWDS